MSNGIFYSVSLIMLRISWTWGVLGGGSKFDFSEHSHVAYQIEGGDECQQ